MSQPEPKTVGFHDNTFFLQQPPKTAHRPGLDAILLAATVPPEFSGVVADFGAGNGVVGMAVLNTCPKGHVHLIERSPNSCELMQRAKDDPRNAHIAARMTIVPADLLDKRSIREVEALSGMGYDCVLANPPFNTVHHRRSPNTERAEAHHAENGEIAVWVHAANRLLKPAGEASFIIRPDNLAEVLEGMSRAFGDIRVKPIHPRRGKSAIRLIVRATKASRAGIKFLSPFFIHKKNGEFRSRTESILRGRGYLSMSG